MAETFPNFEGYVETECGGWKATGGECGGCGRKSDRLTRGRGHEDDPSFIINDNYCEYCVRYMFGCDETEAVIKAYVGEQLVGGFRS